MNRKNLFFVLIIVFCSFFSFLFLRDQVLGADSFYYANLSCGKMAVEHNILPLEYLFLLIPCNPFAWKLLLFFNALFVAWSLLKLFEELKLENKHVGILLLFGLSFVMFFFGKFENDQFAFGFLILSISYALRLKKWFSFDRNLLKSLACLIVAGCFWGGSIYYAFFLSLFSPIFLLISIASILVFGLTPFTWLIPNAIVAENMMFLGFIYLGLLPFIAIGWFKLPKKFLIGTLAFYAIALMNSKFWHLAIPFATAWALNGFNSLKNPMIKQVIITISILMLLALLNPKITGEYPANQDLNVVKEAIKISPDLNNSFGQGYLIKYFNGNPIQYGAFHEDLNVYKLKGLIVSMADLNCEILKKGKYINLYYCE